MKKSRMAAALLASLLLFAGCAKREESLGILYKITGGKNEMWVLGSIHIGNESMQQYGGELARAMAAADAFVFECDTKSPEAAKSVQTMMKAAVPLAQTVSPETYAMLQKVAQVTGTPMESYDAMRPWAVTSVLSTRTAAAELHVKDASRALGMGVEGKVRSAVGDRPVLYLETAEEQLSVLDGFSAPLQERMLQSACEMILEPPQTSLAQWPDWWRTGDAEAFANAYLQEEPVADPLLAKEYHQGLVTERNQKMARRLQSLLEDETSRRYFVTVGLLHLVLPGDSVLCELEKLGYEVRRAEEPETDPA